MDGSNFFQGIIWKRLEGTRSAHRGEKKNHEQREKNFLLGEWVSQEKPGRQGVSEPSLRNGMRRELRGITAGEVWKSGQ